MASTEEEIVPSPVNHSTPKQHEKTFGHELEDCPERKSLQTLQQSAVDETALVGIGLTHTKHSQSTEKTKFRPSHGQVKLYQDVDNAKNDNDRLGVVVAHSKGTQTDDSLLEDLIQQRLLEHGKRDHSLVEEEENEAYELMVKEPVPENYWKEVAEQRRLALSDTLEENKSLHQSIESLKDENERLSELASHADELSAMLQSVVSDEGEGDKESQEGEKEQTNPQMTEGDADVNSHLSTQSSGSDPVQGDIGANSGGVLGTTNSDNEGDSKSNAEETETEHK